jgi:hypothetical protein
MLWQIYYDPLIQHIYSKYERYTILATKQNLLFPIKYQTILLFSILAYMDNTLWIADSQQQFHDSINIHKMTNIKVNPHKSNLISNTKHTPIFNFMNSTIQIQALSIFLKFLEF